MILWHKNSTAARKGLLKEIKIPYEVHCLLNCWTGDWINAKGSSFADITQQFSSGVNLSGLITLNHDTGFKFFNYYKNSLRKIKIVVLDSIDISF